MRTRRGRGVGAMGERRGGKFRWGTVNDNRRYVGIKRLNDATVTLWDDEKKLKYSGQ